MWTKWELKAKLRATRPVVERRFATGRSNRGQPFRPIMAAEDRGHPLPPSVSTRRVVLTFDATRMFKRKCFRQSACVHLGWCAHSCLHEHALSSLKIEPRHMQLRSYATAVFKAQFCQARLSESAAVFLGSIARPHSPADAAGKSLDSTSYIPRIKYAKAACRITGSIINPGLEN